MGEPAAVLRVVDGRLCIVVDAAHGQLLDVLLTQALTARYATGSPLLPAAHAIARAARKAAALRSLDLVPAEGHNRDSGASDASMWLTTAQAAEREGVTPDAIRKRINRARRAGRTTPRTRLLAGRRLICIEGESNR